MKYRVTEELEIVEVNSYIIEANSKEEAIDKYAEELAGLIQPERHYTKPHTKGFEESIKAEKV